MLASFLLWKDSAGFIMQLPRELQAGIQKRLSMYVLRSKVKLADDADTLVRIGLAGKNARTLVLEVVDNVPALKEAVPLKLGVVQGGLTTVLCLATDRFELVTSVEPERRKRMG